MDIRHLKYFVEVARQKSFSKAAQILHISQSAISKMIIDTEAEVGLMLLNRNSKSVQLTEAGESFFQRAQQIVNLFDNLIPEIENEAKLDKGKVSIGLPPITGATSFAKLLGRFKINYPQIEILLFEHGSKKIETAIQDGSLDIGIICNSPAADKYDSFTLANDPVWVVAHPDNPISKLPEIDFKTLQNQSFVIYDSEFSLHHVIVDQCRLMGFKPNIIFETSQLELMIQIVAANLGIAFLPSKTCADLDHNSFSTIPLSRPAIFHQMSIIWKKGFCLSHAAQLWIKFAKEYLSKDS
ncbi:MAG: LysR family transcriptional regulator [Veillonellaceae bacterium]|mgnify:FL=1|nr:LysR family transcriptional regulator [Veillonellaceae bacterium]